MKGKSFCVIDKALVRLWLVLAVGAAGSLSDVAEFGLNTANSTPATWLTALGLTCTAALKASLLTALYALCRRNVWLKTFAVSLISIFLALSLLNGFCWLFYGFGISRKLFTIIAETNPNEMGEFWPELSDKLLELARSAGFWIFLASFSALWFLLPRVSRRVLAAGAGGLSLLGLAYIIYVFSATSVGRTDHSVFARSYRCVAGYIKDRAMIRRLQAQKRPLPYPETLSSQRRAERITVVIGESASRDHLSLYGHPLPTTPRLDSISEGLYRFDDALASSTSTAQNMPRLLTFMTDMPDEGEWYEYPSLLQLFGSLGYRTYWLSNQESSGKWSNLSAILSSDADVVEYVGSIDSEDHYTVRLDDALLPQWRAAQASGDSLQLAFLHLMGSHFQYANRFPKDRRRFTAEDVARTSPRPWLDDRKAEIAADYDNSILYTDSILGLLLKDVDAQRQPAVLIYLSDHGENVYDDRDYRGRDPEYAKVPFLIYANEAYRTQNPDIMESIGASLGKPFSTSELPQMLLHLSGTRYQLYDSVRDPLSDAFLPRKRWVDGK